MVAAIFGPMRIAVNARFLLPERLEGFGLFTQEVLRVMVQQHPAHEFHLFFDQPFDSKFVFAANVQGHVLSPAARHPLLWKYWFDVQVPRMLKTLKADVFFSPDGQCSLRTKVPQVLAVHDLGFLHRPGDYRTSHLRYYKYYTPRFLRKAQSVLTVSDFSKQDIIAQYNTPAEKIGVVHNGVKEIFAPLDYDAKDAMKENYAAGTEYFLYAGTLQPRKNLINLLKAFSVFKRRLHSAFKLVLAGRLAWKNDEFLELLKTYKYRDDVVLTGHLPEAELARLMASAYAFVYPSFFEGFGLPVAEAMRCGVPVLTAKASAMEEVSAGVALYFNPHSVDEMAEALMRIYKDEDGRRERVQKGLAVADRYTWATTGEKVWDALQKAAKT